MEIYNDKKSKVQESEDNMGFTLTEDLIAKAGKIALAMGDSQEAVTIPEALGLILVRDGSAAYHDRKGLVENSGIGIPKKFKTIANGVETETLFFICTK